MDRKTNWIGYQVFAEKYGKQQHKTLKTNVTLKENISKWSEANSLGRPKDLQTISMRLKKSDTYLKINSNLKTKDANPHFLATPLLASNSVNYAINRALLTV